MSIRIYHNPACGTSRNALALIRNAGIEPEIVAYLENPPDGDTLLGLAAAAGVPLRALLRRKGTPFEALGLDDPALPDGALLDAIRRHPILIDRPIVATPRGVALCRPSERVLDLLEAPQRTDFVKEDGLPVVTARPLAADERATFAGLLAAHGMPTADLDLPGRQFYAFRTTLGTPVAYGGLEGIGPDRLLRSLLVLPDRRGRRHGEAAALALERLAGADGATRLHLLTRHAAGFFARLGYAPADRAAAPPAIAGTLEFGELCPADAAYLAKPVRQRW